MLNTPKKAIYHLRGISPGFTVLELAVVICITVAVLAVATPMTIQYLQQRGARQAADQLALDLQRAKLLAIQRNINCSVTINDPAPNQYTISITNEVVDLSGYHGQVVFTDAPDASTPVITFTPQGVCLAAGAFYITDQNRRYRIRTSIAGAVSVHLFAGGQWV